MKTIAIMLVSHFVADFLLQSRDMGKNKSVYVSVLFKHIAIQFGVMALALLFVCSPIMALKISFLNAMVHGLIDWNIWKAYKAYAYLSVLRTVAKKHGMWTQPPEKDLNVKLEIANWKYWEDHWFYATIGFDQLLHALTLVALVAWML